MMKQQTIKRVTISVLVTLLIASMCFAMCTSMFRENASAANSSPYISLSKQNIDTKKEEFYDNSVIYRLPSTVKDTDTISLIVNVKQDSLLDVYKSTKTDMSFSEYALTDEANEIRSKILSLRSELLSDLDSSSINYGTGAFYSSVLSGFEITVKAADFEKTCKLFGDRANVIVGDAYERAETQLVENNVNVYDTGIFDSSKFGYDGTGMVVAVLDTGIDYGHSAFSLENFTADRSKLGLTFDKVAALMENKSFASERLFDGLTASDVYINEKIPFGFDYADYDPDVFPIKSDHGTHVSGIIAGKDDTITGVAPNAQLVEMKIFSDTQDTSLSSWILTALEDCLLLGVDVINMSIGTSCGFSRETDKEAISGVYDDIRDAGISLVVAASNSFNSTYGSEKNGNLGLTSNPDSGTVGSPSTYNGALCIASVSGTKTPYLLHNNTIMYFIESSDKYSEEKVFLDDILPDGVDEMEIEYVTIPGVGRRADYAGMDVKGKIALVKRGDNTFEEKANIAQENGAAGIIIYNNVSGDIKMNVGDITIGACSISQDDGEVLAASANGTLKISRSQTSGPFMSDFSSWGPTPDLKIKPELTAHGGSIYSSVPGQAYDRISGTSMACPNIAGATALLRQYVINNFPSIADNRVEIARVVNRLFMSTADIVMNTNGLPYAIRKQGAGLASLDKAAATNAYIITYDENGNAMDKTKAELGDDPEKTGVYTLRFSVYNFGNTTLTYDISAYVMTEGVSDTKTHDGKTTVTEQAYILDGARISISSGSVTGNTVSVGAGQTADVSVTITLSDSDKKYLDSSFENGMYVEGFIVLEANEESSVDLSLPYLAFYGDWTVAPMFDIDYFETNKDELDDSISLLDKKLPDAYATRPVGGLSGDYANYLGSYYFIQNPDSTPIAADRKYISLSNQDDSVNSLKFVWAGMLRGASKIDITITDNATGEVVYTKTEEYIRKSYGDGGSIYPANIKIDFSAIENNLKNNSSYTVKLQGYLDDGNDDFTDDGNGENTNLNNTFEFPLVTDFEAPAVTDCEFYTEYDKSTKKTRLFAKLAVYDNHYAMAMQFGYVTYNPGDEASFALESFDTYLTPVYSEYNSTTYVIYELTDYIYQIKNNSYNKNTFTVACYDYALNMATYEISLPDEYVDLYFENDSITLSPNEVYTLNPLIYPDTQWPQLLEFSVSVPSSGEVARVVNNKLIAIAPGKCRVTATATDPVTNRKKQAHLMLTVLGEGDDGYVKYDKTVADNFSLTGYYVDKAYYMIDNTSREISITGDNVKFHGTNYSLKMYPSEAITLQYRLDAYYPKDTEVVFQSSNDKIVTVDENGKIVAVSEGFASISVNVMLDGKSTFYSQSINIEVKNPFINSGPSLTHYYGNGGTVVFPENIAITEIGQFAFSNFDYIEKDTSKGDLINDDYPELTKIWFIGDDTIEKVIIPHGVEKIGNYAFANLTALKEVVLPSTLKLIDQGAFYGCTSLTTISYMDENGKITSGNGLRGVSLINQSAFENTNLDGTYSFDKTVAIAGYAFRGNKNLDGIILGKNTVSVGNSAFENNSSLKTLTINAEKIKVGTAAFAGCSSLREVSLNTEVIPSRLFDGASKLTTVNLGASVSLISEYAFANTAIDMVNFDSGNKNFKSTDNYIVNYAGDTLVLVLPYVKGEFTLDNPDITTIGTGAFAANKKITSVNIPYVTKVEGYAFSGCEKIESITLGQLTYVGDYAFYNTKITALPSIENLSKIGDYAFSRTRIKSVAIGDNVEIGQRAFAECLVLESISIGNNVKIGDYAFGLTTKDNWNVVQGADGNYYYEFSSPIHSLTIGDNAVIGTGAFSGAAELRKAELGNGAKIGEYAFYGAYRLTDIDLSRAVSIGDFAFSGDGYNVYKDSGCKIPLVDGNEYVSRYYCASFESIDLSSATEIGINSFAGCSSLKSVVLGNGITSIPDRAFIMCTSLTDINLGKVTSIGSNAFAKTALTDIDISNAESIGSYSFTNCDSLTSVIFNANKFSVEEGAFSNCHLLAELGNIQCAAKIGDYAFAYTAVTAVDLAGAEEIGTLAFAKDKLTEFTVALGSSLKTLGDNPFAFCRLAPFSIEEETEFNGKIYKVPSYTYDINEFTSVINGSLYAKVPYGLELVCYAGNNKTEKVADGTVKISAYAFAGSDVESVTLPHTLASIGHKAFYDCSSLKSVIFTSYSAPVLEEEYDLTYYFSFDNIPATGEFSFFESDGVTEIYKEGLRIVPYFMWNVSSLPNNFYYGATFVDYVGHTDGSLMMVRPSNGQNYNSFIFGQYFDEDKTVDGHAAADSITLAAIKAINNLPENIKLSDKALVQAARAAYDLIATTEQQALVTNLNILTDAERRIEDLEYLANQDKETPSETPTEAPTESSGGSSGTSNPAKTVIIICSAVAAIAVIAVIVLMIIRKKQTPPTDGGSDGDAPEDNTHEYNAEPDTSSEDKSGDDTEADASENMPENDTETQPEETDKETSADNAEVSAGENSDNGEQTDEKKL